MLSDLKEKSTIDVNFTPYKLDLGSGRGKLVKKEIRAGKLGFIVDTRGRPMEKHRQPVKLLPFEVLGRED